MVETRRGYHPDHESFGRFMLSDQARKPAIEAAHDVVGVAHALAVKEVGEGQFSENFQVNSEAAPVIVAGNPRVGAEVYNDVRHAAVVEFGAGTRSEDGTKPREGHRVLRRAGSAIGELRGEPG